ncbi:hypothetical protein GCM10007415_04780 [Parapedobacter pyrenivorans]|uniref:Alpha-glucosidase, glycosyl hydrolase family GH31 n=1 Tax=Parapedobacter pyrenivorans TaxID=1305674 RepID=A0A917HE48_9SPHI|nr:TIM-barrel domain-containing protein [Parapedobacter pyrenivorans]GGG76100.1 hypothetical protein GCM10007415_04780 [Parapedobacter pyrenivorans]
MKKPNPFITLLFTFAACTQSLVAQQPILAEGQPAQLDIRAAGEHSIRITLKPISFKADFPKNPAIDDIAYPKPAISLTEISGAVTKKIGNLNVSVSPDPLTVTVTNTTGQEIQKLVFDSEGRLSFNMGDEQILGMGEGGPKPERGADWRNATIEYDRRGRYHKMEPRWQSDTYGSRNPVAMLWGTQGWGIFVATPWVEVDLESSDQNGFFIPWKAPTDVEQPQTQRNQHDQNGKGRHPVKDVVPGLYDLFVFDAHEPTLSMKDFSTITGKAAMPPKWAMGYMQSHRTLKDDDQMIGIVDTFRTRNIPLDAVIYLGTGFAPRGWNEKQPSFEPNPDVFKRKPIDFFNDMKDRNVKVVLHMVPFDRDKLPTLQGTIPPKPNEVLDNSHIFNYWNLHENLVNMGTAAFWPDEGDWFNLFERIKRHQLYYQGSLYTTPNVRPWSLQRNGFPGIAKWGGWVWSGDTQSTWKTLEGQIAVGINYSLSIGPFWGSDIGGFYVTSERTGEMYTRWFQFAAFCGSFRSHTRTWHLGLPWGWGLDDMGPKEDNGRNEPSTDPDRIIAQSEMNNPLVEPIVKKYDELRYQLLPYNYTLAAEARSEGLPMMRAMWLYYPQDEKATSLGDQYLWGRDMLIAPVYKKGATQREVYLPEGEWYDWWTNKKETGKRTVSRTVDLATMPIYVRAGAIIPVDPIRQYATQEVAGPTTIKVYHGADGAFTLYEDDGVTLDYEKGESTQTQFIWNNAGNKLTISPASSGTAKAKTFKVELLPTGTIKEVNYTGKPVDVTF